MEKTELSERACEYRSLVARGLSQTDAASLVGVDIMALERTRRFPVAWIPTPLEIAAGAIEQRAIRQDAMRNELP